MPQPKVTVIIPTHNRPQMLKRAINSVLSQTFDDLEIIVIDEGLKERAANIINSFSNQKIRYLCRDVESGGAAVARNIGIENSKGELIAFLDDDDEWLPEKLEMQIKLFENDAEKNVGFIGCDSEIINQNGEVSNKHFLMPPNLGRELLIHNIMPNTSSILMKKSVIDDVGSFRDIRVIEDWDLWLRASQKYNFDNVRKPLVRYYINDSSLTKKWQDRDIAELMSRFIDMNLNLYKGYPDIFEERLIYVANKFISSGNVDRGRKNLWKAFKIHKTSKNLILTVLTFLGPDIYRVTKKYRANLRAW